MDQKGCIHIYCGNGKGKTTAAMGLCVRAAGNDKKILLMQFLKANSSGEIKILESIPNVAIIKGPDKMKFSIDMTQQEKDALKAHYEQSFGDIVSRVGEYDMLVLDEIVYTIAAGLFSEKLLTNFLKNKPDKLEVVMTGQNPSEALTRLADYVSEINKIKHPYDKGLKSRIGIER